MSELALTGEEVLAWNDTTARNWRTLLTENPDLLALPCDIAGNTTIAEVFQHIVAVELRYAERLAGLPITDYTTLPYDSVQVIFATHDKAIALLREQIASPVDWSERIEYKTRTMGSARSSRKTIFFHAMLHGIRHYAQLATLVRQHGIKPGPPMDYIVMDFEYLKPS
jgi:uncharacterized damage-inducible protein DinB